MTNESMTQMLHHANFREVHRMIPVILNTTRSEVPNFVLFLLLSPKYPFILLYDQPFWG